MQIKLFFLTKDQMLVILALCAPQAFLNSYKNLGSSYTRINHEY